MYKKCAAKASRRKMQSLECCDTSFHRHKGAKTEDEFLPM